MLCPCTPNRDVQMAPGMACEQLQGQWVVMVLVQVMTKASNLSTVIRIC